MKLHRFYIKGHDLPEEGEVTILSEKLTYQMHKVLRLRMGESVILFNGDGNEYLSRIVAYGKKGEVRVHIENVSPNDTSFSKELYLFFSLIKKDNMEWILQKGTELGVSHFIPIISTRSEKKDINVERAEKILIEATEQCGRKIEPRLHPVMKLESGFDFNIPMIVFEPGTEPLNKETFSGETAIGLLIGPEGGWTEEELTLFENKKAAFRSLGTTTLRAETAAITASALLLS